MPDLSPYLTTSLPYDAVKRHYDLVYDAYQAAIQTRRSYYEVAAAEPFDDACRREEDLGAMVDEARVLMDAAETDEEG